MNRWAILDTTNQVLTIVEHDDEAALTVADAHAAAVAEHAALAAAEYHDAVERAEHARWSTGTVGDTPLDVAATMNVPDRPAEPDAPAMWEPPVGAVLIDAEADVQTGDVYDPNDDAWTRPAPAPVPVGEDLGVSALLTGLYTSGALDDESVAAMLGDPSGTRYVLVGEERGDPSRLVRIEGE
jgi:hypothetical protein